MIKIDKGAAWNFADVDHRLRACFYTSTEPCELCGKCGLCIVHVIHHLKQLFRYERPCLHPLFVPT